MIVPGYVPSLASGIGDATPPASCGDDPCTWVDDIWVRDACLSYLRCANPTSPLVVGMDKGFLPGVATAVGQEGGAIVGAVGQGAGQVVGQTAAGLAQGLFVSSDGSTNWMLIGVVGIVGFFVLQSVLAGFRR